jgi:hypothetical protein
MVVDEEVLTTLDKEYRHAVVVFLDDDGYPVSVATSFRAEPGRGVVALDAVDSELQPPEDREVNVVFSHLADQGLRPTLGDAGDPGEPASALLRRVRDALVSVPGITVEYVELVDPETLEPRAEAVPGTVLAVAAFVAGVRLIDNVVLS